MTELRRLKAIKILGEKNPEWVHREVFRILNKEEIWVQSYKKLQEAVGVSFRGSSFDLIDTSSIALLRDLKDKVCKELYTCEKDKLNFSFQSNINEILLNRSAWDYIIVRDVLSSILRVIYDPIFFRLNDGDSRGLNCHLALSRLKQTFKRVNFVIKSSVPFDCSVGTMKSLKKILQKRIDDPRFIKLIERVFCSRIPEGTIPFLRNSRALDLDPLSVILTNIWYYEFDKFIKNLKLDFDSFESDKERTDLIFESSEYLNSNFSDNLRIPLSSPSLTTTRQLETESLWFASGKYPRLHLEYIRFLDQWVLGISCNRLSASRVRNNLENFITRVLGWDLSSHPLEIIDIGLFAVDFLGCSISLSTNSQHVNCGVNVLLAQKCDVHLRITVSISELLRQCTVLGYLKRGKDSFRPTSKTSYTLLEDHVIVIHFQRFWKSMRYYYRVCTNRGKLHYVHRLLRMSCAMTLAHRHRISCSKVFRRYGKNLVCQIPGLDSRVSFP